MKEQIKAKAAEGDYDSAAKLKSELNDIDFNNSSDDVSASSTYEEVEDYDNGKKTASDSEIAHSGFFLDGIFGGGPLSVPGYSYVPEMLGSINFRLGTKWYFGNGYRYRPGLQMTWFRLGFSAANLLGTTYQQPIFMVDLYPVNIGHASILSFNDVLGLEINVNTGLGMEFPIASTIYPMIGIHVNPELKFRYKALAVGLDISIFNGTQMTSNNSLWYAKNIYSLSIGGKF